MYYMITNNEEEEILYQGDVFRLVETMEVLIEDKFGYHPILQENEVEGELEVYIHSDSYELLTENEVEKLEKIGITELNSLGAICSLLNISVVPIPGLQEGEVLTFWNLETAQKMYPSLLS